MQKKVSKKEALTSCGTHLKKGYQYKKGGVIVKTATKKKAAPAIAKKKKK